MRFVYGLCDPETGELRYIGQTTQGVWRIRQHVARAKMRDSRTHTAAWVLQLHYKGTTPEWFILEECCSTELDDAEAFYIALYRSLGARLTNILDHAKTRRGYKVSEETRLKQSKSAYKRTIVADDGTVYESIVAAAQHTCTTPAGVWAVVNKRIVATRGRTFAYADQKP